MSFKVTPKLSGGLGNYLFQLSAAYAISIRDGKEFICDISDETPIHTPFSNYKSNFFRKINIIEQSLDFKIYYEPHFYYKVIPKIEGDLKLDGFFQSEKYFKEYESKIRKLFEISNEDKKFLEQKYLYELNQDTVSIHVRRGNYLERSFYHENQTLDYYNKAISVFNTNNFYLIFSDDIEWCKQNFQHLQNKTFVESNLDYQDLYLMSMCKNNIIANSTFSWWGAWLNENNNKIVAPSKWFGSGLSHYNTKDLYSDTWIII